MYSSIKWVDGKHLQQFSFEKNIRPTDECICGVVAWLGWYPRYPPWSVDLTLPHLRVTHMLQRQRRNGRGWKVPHTMGPRATIKRKDETQKHILDTHTKRCLTNGLILSKMALRWECGGARFLPQNRYTPRERHYTRTRTRIDGIACG